VKKFVDFVSGQILKSPELSKLEVYNLQIS
jgi:hypothetical protein